MRGASILASLAILLLGACHDGGERAAFDVDRIDPAALSFDHDPAEPVRVTFSEPIDEATLDDSTVFLWHVTGFVAADLRNDDATRTVQVTPREPLLPGAEYALVVRRELGSKRGVQLGADVIHTFGTADRRAWGTTATVAVDHDRIGQVSIDAVGDFHVLVAQPYVGGLTRYLRMTAGGIWMPAEVLSTSLGAVVGFDLAYDGTIQGAIAHGVPGETMLREAGAWRPAAPIPVQAPPSDLPQGAPWPDPFNYVWVRGGRVGSALRIGPRVGTRAAEPTDPRCKLVTGTQEIDCAFEAGAEEVWSAIVGPGNADFVLGARVGEPRMIWAWSPGDLERTKIGELRDGREHWTARFGSGAFGQLVVGWINERTGGVPVQPNIPPSGDPGPGDSTPPAHELEIAAARFDPLVGWAPSDVVAARTTATPTPLLETTCSPNGDALVAWSLDLGGGRRSLEIAHFVADGSGLAPVGWSTRLLSERVSAAGGSFAVAQDPSGHAFVAWIEVELGLRRLWLRRYDPRFGWGDAELVVESATDSMRSVHLAAGIYGRVLMVWNQRDAIVARRFE